MNVINTVQETLDRVLLPYGVVSNHLRRVEVDEIENSDVTVNKDEYVVFRVISNRPRKYGDGVQTHSRVYIDVNYYYLYEKTDARVTDAESRAQAAKREILRDKHFRVANDVTPLPDVDNPYRGFNVEFAYIGVVDNG